MAKIKKNSTVEPKKKATKSATMKNRTITPNQKSAGKVTPKTTAEAKATCNSNNTENRATSIVKKTNSSKTIAAKTVKKNMHQAKALAKVMVPTKQLALKPSPKPLPLKQQSVSPQFRCQNVELDIASERKPASTEELRAILLERRNGLLRNIDETDLTQEKEKSVVVGDVADLAQESTENELSFHLAEVESRELGQIDKAIEKIGEGTYGVCEKCGENISPARLKALPFANKCIRCQEEDERGKY